MRTGSGGRVIWGVIGPAVTCCRWVFHGLLLLLCCAGLLNVSAQTANPPATAGEPYRLHVYADLVQVPALVLTSAHEGYRGLNADRFSVQLDGGPKFHPRQVRTEGDDPLAFAVLLDARRGEHTDLVRAMAASVHLPDGVFTERDRLSVFAYDCTLVSSVVDVPASPAALQAAASAALSAAGLHGTGDKRPRCRQPGHLWDAVAAVTGQLAHLPGRRVLVLVSDGNDFGSSVPVETVRGQAAGAGLAIFGIQPASPQRAVLGLGVPSNLFRETALVDPFSVLCAQTGGLVAGARVDDLAPTLERIVRLVRARYILEFTRPRNAAVGGHEMDVSVADPSAIVRTSGVTVSIQDEAQRTDARTVPHDTSRDPVIGSRK